MFLLIVVLESFISHKTSGLTVYQIDLKMSFIAVKRDNF